MRTSVTLAILISVIKGSEIDQNATHYDYRQGTGRIIESFHYVHFNVNTTTLKVTYSKILSSYTLLSFRKELKESNLLKQAEILCDELHQTLQQIIPSQNRPRRGLVNGIGTAIKYIFGNPDANDLDRINNYLNSIEYQQHENIKILNESVSAINKISQSINERTEIINKNLENISNILSKQDTKLHLFETVVTLIVQEQHFLGLLNKIKRSFIFSDQTFDLEILNYEQILDMRIYLSKIYSQKELIFHHHNLFDFRFIQGSIVFTQNSIVYTLKIPILNPIKFSLFQRLATINYSNHTEIITSPWLLIGTSIKLFSNQCRQISEQNYLCQQLTTEENHSIIITTTLPLLLAYFLSNDLTLISSNYLISVECSNITTTFLGTRLVNSKDIRIQGHNLDKNLGEFKSSNLFLPLVIKDHKINFESLKTLTLSPLHPVNMPSPLNFGPEFYIPITIALLLSITIISGLIYLCYKQNKETKRTIKKINAEDVIELRPGGVM